jgi:hypothetical protein
MSGRRKITFIRHLMTRHLMTFVLKFNSMGYCWMAYAAENNGNVKEGDLARYKNQVCPFSS